MKMKRAVLLLRVFTASLFCVLTVSPSFAQEPAGAIATAAAKSLSAGSAMQEYMKLMMPGEEHKLFGKMTGKWICKMKIWNSAMPAAPPVESTEESESKLILGGRFLLEESKGAMMGMPLQRLSVLGYDNYKKTYTLIFYSNMDTATNAASGTLDGEGNVLTLRGEFDEPQGKNHFKNVMRIESDDVRVFESYKILPDGKEVKAIEEIFTRVQ
jgi:hypothetical protein